MTSLEEEEEQQQRADEDARCEELREWVSWKLDHEMIKSELIGLYDEMDKLVQILPKEPITPMLTIMLIFSTCADDQTLDLGRT